MKAIPKRWISALRGDHAVHAIEEEEENKGVLTFQFKEGIYSENNLTSKIVYRSLKNTAKNRWQRQWEQEFGEEVEWDSVHLMMKSKLIENKIKVFVWKSINYGLNTKEKVSKMGKCDEMCSFCSLEKETILHLFCECEFVLPVWQAIYSVSRDVCEADFRDSKTIILDVMIAMVVP